MRQGSRFNLEDVVSRLPGRNASLRWMYAFHGELGNEDSSARVELRRNWATPNHVFVRVVKDLRPQPSSTPVETTRNPIRTWSGFLFLWL